MKTIALLGSTGSIGTQCLDIIRENSSDFRVSALTCGRNINLLSKQIEEFKRMTRVQREKVLLSVPNFFNSVEFSKKEEKAIIEWFRT